VNIVERDCIGFVMMKRNRISLKSTPDSRLLCTVNFYNVYSFFKCYNNIIQSKHGISTEQQEYPESHGQVVSFQSHLRHPPAINSNTVLTTRRIGENKGDECECESFRSIRSNVIATKVQGGEIGSHFRSSQSLSTSIPNVVAIEIQGSEFG